MLPPGGQGSVPPVTARTEVRATLLSLLPRVREYFPSFRFIVLMDRIRILSNGQKGGACHPRESGDPAFGVLSLFGFWIPAFAGMTLSKIVVFLS
jgi:hypothetical protein